ncbi:MAG: uracil-DNA glycosylase family protein [Candidatus Hadarchaeaceae archaeon]
MRKIKVCTLCELHRSRKNAVPGEGPLNAEILFCGEAPGHNEDLQAKPFVGSAGKFLNELLKIAGLLREDVYVTNVAKCRPPKNRDPSDDEIETCTTNYLQKQIVMIKPKFVVALGRIAARVLLGRYVVMGKEHGRLLDCTYGGASFKLFLTYHPAAALYGAETKTRLQADFKKLGQIVKSMV